MHMEIPDYIAIVSIGISIGGGIYAAVTNTKKYELAEQYKRGKRSIASTFHHLCPSAIIVSYYTQSKKFSTRLF